MASTDARPIPQKNVAYRVTFPILDADGDLVTGATGLDSEVSKDGGTFADCTNEATEIATSSGMYFLDLTSTEMNADTVAIIVKTSSSGAKTTPIVLYPEEAGDVRVNVTQINSVTAVAPGATGGPAILVSHGGTAQAGAAGSITLAAGASATDDLYKGQTVSIVSGTGAGQARVISGYVGSTKVASVSRNWATNPDNTSVYQVKCLASPSMNAALEVVSASVTGNVGGNVAGSVGSVASGGITAASLAADAITAAKIADGAIDAATFAAGAINAAAIATDAITAAKIAADAIGASELAADAVTEIQSGLATAASIAALNNLSAAQVNAEVDTALADVRLDELLAADSDIDGAAPPTVGSVFHELMTKTSGSFTYDQTTDSLEAIKDSGGGGLTAQQVADAVWDEPIAGHVDSGSTGEALSAAGGAGDPWITALPGAYSSGQAGFIVGTNLNATVSSRASQASIDAVDDFLDTEVAAILADTNELQTDWANGGRLDNILDARASQTSVDDLPTNAELATSQAAADDATLAAIAALNNLSAAQVNAEVLDVLNVDTFAELASIPAATTTLTNMLRLIYAFCANEVRETASVQTLRNRADSATIGTASVADDGTTYTRDSFS